MSDPTTRFSDRVDNYVKYRPGYPPELLPFLEKEHLLAPGMRIADIGAGTGILTRLLLEGGNTVYAVEPNREMRSAAQTLLKRFDTLTTVNGTAEASGLEAASVDLIMAAQAFHWFDADRAKKEFRRIARPGASVVLVWNERQMSSPFLQEYEKLLRTFAIDYAQVDHRNVSSATIRDFFAPSEVHTHTFPLSQHFDLDGLRGRLLSSSYMPTDNTQGRFDEMIAALEQLFEKHQHNGLISLDYITQVFYGRVS